MDRILVTGGAGFIGSHFVKRLLRGASTHVTVLDALTYAGHRANLGKALASPRLTFIEGNVLDAALMDELVSHHDAIVHFAAESHVDRSFYAAGAFLSTNVVGTHTLVEAAARHGVERFVHVSTDEVYGPWVTGQATERALLAPTVPYAASKAAGDLVALSYHRTFGVPVCVTRSSNNYGTAQHPEKIIPLFITSLLKGGQVTIHGDGEHVRNWLHVEDNCAGIELVLRGGQPGEVYNLGGGVDLTNRQLTAILLEACGAGWDSVRYVPDRRANDARYAIDWSKAAVELGYRPTRDLAEGLAETVAWYREHPERWAPAERNQQAPMARIRLDAAAAGEQA